jgi:hypothetical protein
LFEQYLDNNTLINQGKVIPDATEIFITDKMILEYFFYHYNIKGEVANTCIVTSQILNLLSLGEIGKAKQEYLSKADLSRGQFLLLGNISNSALIELIDTNSTEVFKFMGKIDVEYRGISYSKLILLISPQLKVVGLIK